MSQKGSSPARLMGGLKSLDGEAACLVLVASPLCLRRQSAHGFRVHALRACPGMTAARAVGTPDYSFSAWIGTDRTFGIPHAVEMRMLPDNPGNVWVITVVTTAAIRPSQS